MKNSLEEYEYLLGDILQIMAREWMVINLAWDFNREKVCACCMTTSQNEVSVVCIDIKIIANFSTRQKQDNIIQLHQVNES